MAQKQKRIKKQTIKEKNKNKNRLAQNKWCGQKSVKAVREEEVKLWGGGKICKTCRF